MDIFEGWLTVNISWILSGIGVAVVLLITAIIKKIYINIIISRNNRHWKMITITDSKKVVRNAKISAHSDIKSIITGVIENKDSPNHKD